MTFRCSRCGAESSAAASQCRACHCWGTFAQSPGAKRRSSGPTKLSNVSGRRLPRITSGFGSLDAALGGGFVKGSPYLLAGEPGTGKSTIALQMMEGKHALLIEGEESEAAVAARADRLGIDKAGLSIWSTSDVANLDSDRTRYDLIVANSIQELSLRGVGGRAGSVTQTVEVARRIRDHGRNIGATVILIGQVNADGDIAGPRSVDHLVDGSLTFKKDDVSGLRTLCVTKHRHGPAPKTVEFFMTAEGLRPKPRELAVVKGGV